jgi:hypothetical protein
MLKSEIDGIKTLFEMLPYPPLEPVKSLREIARNDSLPVRDRAAIMHISDNLLRKLIVAEFGLPSPIEETDSFLEQRRAYIGQVANFFCAGYDTYLSLKLDQAQTGKGSAILLLRRKSSCGLGVLEDVLKRILPHQEGSPFYGFDGKNKPRFEFYEDDSGFKLASPILLGYTVEKMREIYGQIHKHMDCDSLEPLRFTRRNSKRRAEYESFLAKAIPADFLPELRA